MCKQMGDVFISYRHCNIDLVKPIVAEFDRRGISYFVDWNDIDYGDEYPKIISNAISVCNVLLLIWTKDVQNSDDIASEVGLAKGQHKKIIPYKIGNFDVYEHGSLIYPLINRSRYETLQQTPESITEIVNRVQQALLEISYRQYTYDLPDKSKDAVIEKMIIEDINVTITPKVNEHPKNESNNMPVEPLPDDLISILSEKQDLQDAIEQIKSFQHISLTQANNALDHAQAQYDAWKERKERLWKDLPQAIQQSLEKTIVNNPECTEKDIQDIIDNLSNTQYFDFLEKFQCGKKFEQAKQELERVKHERLSKCNEVINSIQRQIEKNNKRYNQSLQKFFDKAIMKILSTMPGYDNIDADFPEFSILEPIKQLDKYNLGWRADTIFNHARKLWVEERPCVIKEKKDVFHGCLFLLSMAFITIVIILKVIYAASFSVVIVLFFLLVMLTIFLSIFVVKAVAISKFVFKHYIRKWKK